MDYRLRRLEIALEGQTGRLSRLEQKTFGSSGVMKPDTQAQAPTTTSTQALIDAGGTDPDAKAPPRRRPKDDRPIPKTGGQSHYGGRPDKDGNIILDNNNNVQIFKLNFADRAWGFFKSARGRLRRWSRGIRSRENKFLYLDITLREIIDDLEEQNDAIDTRLIIEAVETLEDFLKPLPRQDTEIDGTWKIVHFIRGLFE